MNKVLLTLGMVAVTALSHCMEPQWEKLSLISLPQTHSHLSHHLLPEIAQHILSLQIKTSGVNLAELPKAIEQSCAGPYDLMKCIDKLIESCAYTISVELFKKYFPHKEKSICDIKDWGGHTALHYAAEDGLTETAKLLLDAAGDNPYTVLTMQNTDDGTALHRAAWNGHTKTAKLLLNVAGDNAYAVLTMQDSWSQTALHGAAWNGHIEIAKLLLDAVGNNAYILLTMQSGSGKTALYCAAWKGYPETVKFLLNAAGDKVQDYMAMKTKEGKTAFDVANGEVQEVIKPYMQSNNQS